MRQWPLGGVVFDTDVSYLKKEIGAGRVWNRGQEQFASNFAARTFEFCISARGG